MPPLITCKNVTKTFPGHDSPVIDSISLEFPKGCFVSIMGRSGSGKSTLLKMLCGLTAPDLGEVFVAGYDLAKMTPKERSHFRSSVIGIVFQDGNLIDDYSVRDNILTPLYISGQKADSKHLARVLELTELTKWQNKMPYELSGGMRQRVAIARALVSKPQVLFADEPTGNLDSKSESQIMELFACVNKEFGTSIIQVTHSEFCAKKGNRIIKINDGKVGAT